MGLDILCYGRERAEMEAWNELSKGHFKSFGYWTEVWERENESVSKILRVEPKPNPWRTLVRIAQGQKRIEEASW